MNSKKLWIGITLAVSFGLVWERLLPGLVERQINRVTEHSAWRVSDEARALHASIPIVDLHADPLLWKRDWLTHANRGHTDLPRLQKGGFALQVFGAVTKSPMGENYSQNSADSDSLFYLTIAQRWPLETWSGLFARSIYQADKLQDWDNRAGENFRIIRNQGDISDLAVARAAGGLAVGGIFALEGAHALEGSLDNLRTLHARGLRVLGLTHFFDNRLGGSLHGESGDGLSPFGRKVIREANRLGLIIDVAHASPQMVRDVLKLSERPVILSHGGFAGICDNGRNLDDELMAELARADALIGVGFWSGAVCDESPEGIVRAIRYGIELMGIEHIALGSDYDGATKVLFDASELPILTQTMLDQGMNESDIRRVMGENAFRFFATNLPQRLEKSPEHDVPKR